MNNKWNTVNQSMKENKIGVLCIQESHLNEGYIENIHALYGRRLRVMNSEGVRATAAHGVAFILNRELVDIADIHMKEIVPGRAAYINMHWHAEKQITILNVYAPNGATDNQDFWKKLKSEYENNRHPKPDIVLGDFNLVEEAVDRLPAREDPDGPVQELKALLQHLDVYDGWRLAEPTAADFTFPQRGSQQRSRLDRIYTRDPLIRSSASWTIETTGIPTDH